jgi:hypothetical protein
LDSRLLGTLDAEQLAFASAADAADNPDDNADEQRYKDEACPDAGFEDAAYNFAGRHGGGNEQKEVEEGESVDHHSFRDIDLRVLYAGYSKGFGMGNGRRACAENPACLRNPGGLASYRNSEP